MTAGPGWQLALERASRSRMAMILGAIDSGKTFLTTFLANGLLDRGFRVGVVDADLGQSEIGLPTTIGLGCVTRALQRLGDAEVAGLFFVGSTSPQGHVLSTVTGARRMTDKAAELGLDRLLVDTSGLVDGELGRTLKQHKIELLDPDLVICLERARECEPILNPYAGRRRPEVVRLGVSELARRRPTEERRRHRERAFDAYFRGASTLRLPLGEVALRPMSDRHDLRALGPAGGDELEGILVGLDDSAGETLGLGIVRRIDLDGPALLVDTPLPGTRISGVRLGRHAVELATSPVTA